MKIKLAICWSFYSLLLSLNGLSLSPQSYVSKEAESFPGDVDMKSYAEQQLVPVQLRDQRLICVHPSVGAIMRCMNDLLRARRHYSQPDAGMFRRFVHGVVETQEEQELEVGDEVDRVITAIG